MIGDGLSIKNGSFNKFQSFSNEGFNLIHFVDLALASRLPQIQVPLLLLCKAFSWLGCVFDNGVGLPVSLAHLLSFPETFPGVIYRDHLSKLLQLLE